MPVPNASSPEENSDLKTVQHRTAWLFFVSFLAMKKEKSIQHAACHWSQAKFNELTPLK